MHTVYGSCPDILSIAKRRKSRRHYCAPCKSTFTSAAQLRAHTQTKHLSGTAAIFTKPSLKRYPCELCHAPCSGICDYLQHLQQHFFRMYSTCPVCGSRVENTSLPAHLDHHEHEWFTRRDIKADITYRAVPNLADIRGRISTGPEDQKNCLACQLSLDQNALLLHNCKTKTPPKLSTCIQDAFPALGL
jgi:hypothetical protein